LYILTYQSFKMKPIAFLLSLCCTVSMTACLKKSPDTANQPAQPAVSAANVFPILQLQEGFAANIIVDSCGKARHIVADERGNLFVKLEKLSNGKGMLWLKDTNNDGKYEVQKAFGTFTGTGIRLHNGALYASSNSEIFKYKLNPDGSPTDDAPQPIVVGMVNLNQHESKTFTFDAQNNIYVNIGAPSNCCQVEDRKQGSKGKDPCPILETAGGVWQFKGDKMNQKQSDGVRFSTGSRNIVGMVWNNTYNNLYAMQHGRDMLHVHFPEIFTPESAVELPAEEFLLIKKGANFGWPYCYFDHIQDKKVLAPEYGGDGKTQARCEGMDRPILGFPGHWAPNDLLFYTGNQFPEKYKNGAFIAFHGSWNRVARQEGYKVIFVPFGKDGKPSGKYEVFADGFAGKGQLKSAGDAMARPCGLAQAADGSLLISDSRKGTIWKIGYQK
jgi:glucose/arabinose dehydrogenase